MTKETFELAGDIQRILQNYQEDLEFFQNVKGIKGFKASNNEIYDIINQDVISDTFDEIIKAIVVNIEKKISEYEQKFKQL